MSTPYPTQQNIKTKTTLLIFLKGSVAPIVLYLDNPQAVYENMQKILKTAQAPRMVELEANGPIKKVSIITTEVTGLALQEEQYIAKP